MAYTCPKCGGPVQRGTHSGAAAVGGVVGAMLGAAFASFECPKDGVIERASFPPEVRTELNLFLSVQPFFLVPYFLPGELPGGGSPHRA